LINRWHGAHPGGVTFYLSTGAWDTAPALRRFLHRHDFPPGPLLLTDWGPTNTGWFRSGPAHKIGSIQRLMRELPQLSWVFLGDDGQHDPEIYADAVTEYPERVDMVAIRQLTATEQMLAHGIPQPLRQAHSDAAAHVLVGSDGHELLLRAIDAGLVPPSTK
jgi:phosphatidate phosphatase APP1